MRVVPFAGDAFDAVFKANQRNVKLLNGWLEHGAEGDRALQPGVRHRARARRRSFPAAAGGPGPAAGALDLAVVLTKPNWVSDFCSQGMQLPRMTNWRPLV